MLQKKVIILSAQDAEIPLQQNCRVKNLCSEKAPLLRQPSVQIQPAKVLQANIAA